MDYLLTIGCSASKIAFSEEKKHILVYDCFSNVRKIELYVICIPISKNSCIWSMNLIRCSNNDLQVNKQNRHLLNNS